MNFAMASDSSRAARSAITPGAAATATFRTDSGGIVTASRLTRM